ncbi:helix-turn-helix domain-containing protein [Acrocarpospora sp. B8E8]|uniref:helix-turn-helix domain-containing protein n=1 Tax=Acrocarpospora sp. B8E8 TaxID=3153572 RepID=UPI00325EAAAA
MLKRRYAAGASLRELAALAGVSYSTMRARFLDAGVRLRPRGPSGIRVRAARSGRGRDGDG